jgi:hypothetical protein
MIIGRKVMIAIGKVLSRSPSTRLPGEAELVWLEMSHNATTPQRHTNVNIRAEVWYVVGSVL